MQSWKAVAILVSIVSGLRKADTVGASTLALADLVESIMVFTIVVVHDTFIAEGLGFFASLAGADGVQSD